MVELFYCSLFESDPDQCIKLCQGLVDEPRLDSAVRLGDVFGLMIEHYGQSGDYQQVSTYIFYCM